MIRDLQAAKSQETTADERQTAYSSGRHSNAERPVAVTDVSRLQDDLKDIQVALDAEREAKLVLESKHRALTDEHQLLAKLVILVCVCVL